MISSQHQHFGDDDIILATLPISGTTWLKGLIFSVVNRDCLSKNETSPLLTTNPHDLVPFLEAPGGIYNNDEPDRAGGVRVFSTHLHYPLLPPSVKDSKCRIVYGVRNPLDTLVSFWNFQGMLPSEANESQRPLLSIQEAYDKHCEGRHLGGPFWDNILGYWNVSLEKPEKVLFVMYEDLKEDVVSQLRVLAKFLGFPFTAEEEGEGAAEEIAKLCGFENLKNLEVNNSGTVRIIGQVSADSFFRKRKMGDYVNHLTPAMIENFEKLVEDKFGGSGLVFKSFPQGQERS